jgi:hypothetical protein
MATLSANISATQTVVPVSGTAPEPGSYFTLNSEAVRFLGTSRGPGGRSFLRSFWSVDRGVAGTTKATHSSGATLTQYYPDAAGSGGGGSISATDGMTTVDPATSINVPLGALVDLGSGVMGLGFSGPTAVEGDPDVTVDLTQDLNVHGLGYGYEGFRVTSEDGNAEVRIRATTTGNGRSTVSPYALGAGLADADARSRAETVDGDADAGSYARVTGGGDAAAISQAESQGAGYAAAYPYALATGSGPAYAGPVASSQSGLANATTIATADTGVPTSGVKAVRGATEASLIVSVSSGGVASFIAVGLPTADPGIAGQLYSDGAPSAGVPKALMVSGG